MASTDMCGSACLCLAPITSNLAVFGFLIFFPLLQTCRETIWEVAVCYPMRHKETGSLGRVQGDAELST